MAGFKVPGPFPGITSLPRPIRALAEFAFPQTPDIPTPVGGAVAAPVKAGIRGSASDLLSNPRAMSMMQKMYDEAVRMTGKMTASTGKIEIDPKTLSELSPMNLRPRTMAEAEALLPKNFGKPKPQRPNLWGLASNFEDR